MRDRLTQITSLPYLAEGIALLSGLIYLLQTGKFAHTQTSVLDEGAYLYKGLLFLSGQYQIYQDYGPLSNHMPLAFYIPGLIQLVLGPGLRAGRYFAIFLGCLTLLGIWLLVRRFGGRWWAAGAVLIVALTPTYPKMYSLAISQVLIICMLIWALVLTLGDDRPLWQICLGAVLASMMMLTRINLTPVLPLLIAFIFWQHGSKAGLAATLAGGLTVLVGHAIFWPGIMQNWAKWLPYQLTPFLDGWRTQGVLGSWSWNPNPDLKSKLISTFMAFRFHFVALFGMIAAWLLWPFRGKWKTKSGFRVFIFLSILFAVLLLAHMWATLWMDACVFCLPGYLGFFSLIGLIIIVISIPFWRRKLPVWHQLLIFLYIVLICTGIGFSAFEDIGYTLQNLQIPRWLIDSTTREPGTVSLEAILINKFHFDSPDLRRLLPAGTGLMIGLFIVILAVAIVMIVKYHQSKRLAYTNGNFVPSPGYVAIVIMLIVGILLTSTVVLGGGYKGYDCGGDNIRAYEAVGQHLAKLIPPGSSVYWKGGLSVIPLLYIPEIKIFPAQINDGYSYYIGGDSESLEKNGLWNGELSEKWANQADFILIQRDEYSAWKDFLNSGNFDELGQSPPVATCIKGSEIRIFRRKS